MFAAVVLIGALRNPLLFRSQFILEEAGAYWAMSFVQDPIKFLLDPWVGYLNVGPRIVFIAGHLVPYEYVPAFERLVEDMLVGGVACFWASRRLANSIPETRIRFAFALSLALLPAADHLGSILQAQWVLAILIVGLSLTRERRWYDYPMGVLAVLSGLPAAIAVAAFWLRRPDKLTILLSAVAVIQFEVALLAPRRHFDIDIAGIVERLWLLGFVLVALALASLLRVPRRPALALGVVAIVTVVAGALSTPYIEQAGRFERFFVAGWAALAFIGIAATARRWVPGVVLLAIVSAVAVPAVIARPAPVPNTNWPAHAHCIGGKTPCVVPIEPAYWSVDWPGDPARYTQPKNRSGT